MTAEIVAIGTEILLGDIADTDSQELGKVLAEFGINHTRRQTVGDNLERCVEAIRDAMARCDVVFTIGGLGPTQDDVTREAIAIASGEELVLDEESEKRMRAFMRARKRPWVESMSRQAMKPATATHIENSVGTAPGILWESGGKTIIALPGPKNEFSAMLQGPIRSYLEGRSDGTIVSKTLKIIGIPESSIEAMVSDLIESENPTVAPYAKLGEVHLRITARADNRKAAEKLIAPVANTIRERFGKACYGEDERELAAEVLELLGSKKRWLATAESCTGGLLAERITQIPGSGDSYMGGFVTYSNEMKARFLGVARTDLAQFGAVSEPVARQMAEGAIRVTGADYGVGITGLAGPGGESEDKPIGLVYVAISGPRGTAVREERFTGDRETIRFRSTQVALQMLREELLAG